MNRRLAVVAALLVLALFAAAGTPAAADIGPKPTWTGRTPGPSGTDVAGIEVRMAEEAVDLVVRREGPAEDRLDVRAVFQMRNDGDTATFETGFPIGAFRNMEKFSVTVDGKPADFDVVDRAAAAPEKDAKPRRSAAHDYWYVWQATYPGRATSTHEVRYTVVLQSGSSVSQKPQHQTIAAGYVLHTGAGWKGPIGKAVVTLRTGGELSLDRLFRVRPQSGGVRHADRVEWTFTDLEPTKEHDIVVHFAATTMEEMLAEAREEAKTTWSGRVRLANVLEEAQDARLRPRNEEELREYLDALAAIIGERGTDGDAATMPAEREGNRPGYLSDPNAIFRWMDVTADVVEQTPGSARAREVLVAYVELCEKFLAGRLLVGGEPLTFPWRGGAETEERRAARDASMAKRRGQTETYLAKAKRVLAGK